MVYVGEAVSWHIVFLPWCLFIHLFFIAGIGLFFSTINVFFRDFGIILSNLLMIVLFSTPIFYSIEQLPAILQTVSIFNQYT